MNKRKTTKDEIKRNLISKDLDELIKPLVAFIVLIGLFGYAGYTYSICNNLDIKHGIIFGSLFPLGIALIKYLNYDTILAYIIYTIAYICLVQNLPTFIGIIILSIIILTFIAAFIHIEKKDRTGQIEQVYKSTEINNNKVINKNNKIVQNNKLEDTLIDDEIDNEISAENEVYECERCFKRISYEEYELNDFMCEDCYQDVHTDKNGNFHDDKYFEL